MKQATLLIVLLATISFAFANPVENRDSSIITGDSASIEISSMQDMLQQVMNVIGVNENIELKEANVLNIEATISHKKRYILYNPAFITSLQTITKNKWSVMALIAHEMGHHLNGHTIRKGGSKPALELEADEFAGFILNKLGATLKESQNVMYYIARTEGSRSHPPRNSRLLAIEKGWKKAAELQGINDAVKN